MKITAETLVARARAGYIAPDQQPCVCEKCTAVTRRRDPSMKGCFAYSSRYYCRRHKFYVHSAGYCPKFSTEPFVEEKMKRQPFKQEWLFK